MRLGMVALLCVAVAMAATAKDKVAPKPKATTSWAAGFTALGDVTEIRTKIDNAEIREAFVYALQGRVLAPDTASIWREVDPASVPLSENVLMIEATGFAATYSESAAMYILVSAPSGIHAFSGLAPATPLAAMQALCDVWTDANYAWNTLLPGPFPHTFGYPPIRCEFSYRQSP